MQKNLFSGILSVLIIATGCGNNNNGSGNKTESDNLPIPTKTLSYSINATYPHDTSSFTEGLLIYKGNLYESTGEYGKSKLLQADLKTGRVVRSIDLDKKYFGEGMVIINDTVYQLTYQEKVGLMYNLKDFKKIGEFKFASPEGWGMTTDGKQIIATDGSSSLFYYEPGTFKLLKQQTITEAGSLAYNLNEVEYIDGFIYANQWQAPYILKIDPGSGQIVAKANLQEVWDRVKIKDPDADVPNGIAYDHDTKKIYVTGKRWPELYEIQFSN